MSFRSINLSNQQFGVFVVHEFIGRYLQVEWCWSFADSPRNVVMRSVTRAEPSVVISSIGHGDASQVGANGQDHDPFVGENSVFVGLWVAQTAHRDGSDFRYFFGKSLSDKNGFATPLNGQRLTIFHCAQIEIGRRQSSCRSGNGKRGYQFHHQQSSSGGIGESNRSKHEVGKGTTLGFGNLVNPIVVESIVDASVIVHGFYARGHGDRRSTAATRLP
jgi:hypothetical protein